MRIFSLLTAGLMVQSADAGGPAVKGVDYDSSVDWTEQATQPDGPWSYGSYPFASAWQSFEQLAGFSTLSGAIGGSGSRWGVEPSVSRFAQLPSSTAWAVRRWTSPVAGTIEIDYDVMRLDDDPADNGQIAGIYQNGTLLWSQDLGNSADGRQYTGTLTTTVLVGDAIDCTVNSKGSSLADWTHFQVSIRTEHLRPVPAAGLAAHWTLDGESSLPTGFGHSRLDRAADRSGNQEPCLLQYMAADDHISGRIGNMLDFDGGNDHLLSLNTDIADGATALTLSAWISPDSQGGWRGILTAKQPTYFGFNSTGYRVNAIEFRANNARVQTLDNAIPFSSWTLVTCVWKSGQIFKIYLNGEEAELDPSVSPSPPSAVMNVDSWYIGSDRLISGRYFNGRIDDAAIWTRALSATEVQELYRLGINGWDVSYLGNAPGGDADLLPYARGLQVWLDAQDIDGQSNRSLTGGEELLSWFNKAGGYAGDATAGDGASFPGIFQKAAGPRGTDTVRFGSNLNGLKLGEFMRSDTFSIFAVAHIDGGQGNRPLFWDYDSTTTPAAVFGTTTAGAWVQDINGDRITAAPARAAFDRQWETGLMILSRSGNSFTLEAGPSEASVTSANPLYNATTWSGTQGAPHIGKKADSTYTDSATGELAEILIFDHALAPADRAAVLQYLERKYFRHEGGTLIRIR